VLYKLYEEKHLNNLFVIYIKKRGETPMRKLFFLLIVLFVVMSLSAAADTIFIDFEGFNEYDSISTVPTAYGNVNFYMTNTNPLLSLNIGDYAALSPTGELPEIGAEDTKTSPSDYIKIVGFTVNDQIFGGTDTTRDDYVRDPAGTGAGGKTLTDTRDMSRSDLLKHAYTKYQSVLIDLSSVQGVQSFSMAAIDLDHTEEWDIFYFDSNNVLINKQTMGPGSGTAGDGKAYPISYTNPNIAKVVFVGSMNLGEYDRLGFALDNIEIEVEEEACEDYTVDLIAGGGNPKSEIDVGQVIVSSDGETLEVIYQTEGSWEITETHLHVACDLEDIPQTQPNKKGSGGGNPIPGHFDYNNNFDPAVTEHTVTINLDDLCCTNPVIASHAVVRETTCSTAGEVYGMERYTGQVYEVDVLAGTAAMKFTASAAASGVTPNGLAYDPLNARFYYNDYREDGNKGNNNLYFWDTMQHVAGLLPYEIAAADFYNGKYYFIDSYPATDDLYEVALNADGTINTITKLADIANNSHKWTFDGDIAVKNNVVYGWGRCGIHGKFEFFTYDLGTGIFNAVTTGYQQSLQLAFGSDGSLYGHRSGGAGEWYQVNVIDGSLTLISSPGVLFTDAASGEICMPSKTETAWGEGYDFPGSNWAMYFSYDLSDCYEPQCLEQESSTITGAALSSPASQAEKATIKSLTETTWLGLISIASIIALAVVSLASFSKLTKK